jgi:endonuclease III
MTAPITLLFTCRPDLAATMDIQIPALAWQRSDEHTWTRRYHLNGLAADVTATADGHALVFQAGQELDDSTRRHLGARLRSHFPRQVAALDLTAHPLLAALGDRYQGVIIMHADPFEALILTVLSQNRTGEIVRTVFPRLDTAAGGITPHQLARLGEAELRQLIRPAGPYKAPRLAAAIRTIAADGPERFTQIITQDPGQALAYLTSLPGVAHKTAACVLVFAAGSDHTLPVDTHLFRVAHRLGFIQHDGRLSRATREAIVSALLGYGPDLAAAHFLFLLLGRSTCTAGPPRCADCFLRSQCPSSPAQPGPAPAAGEAS